MLPFQQSHEVTVLDSYIIDRIRREREQERERGVIVPLRIHTPEPRVEEAEEDEGRDEERGSVVIDFQLEDDDPFRIG